MILTLYIIIIILFSLLFSINIDYYCHYIIDYWIILLLRHYAFAIIDAIYLFILLHYNIGLSLILLILIFIIIIDIAITHYTLLLRWFITHY